MWISKAPATLKLERAQQSSSKKKVAVKQSAASEPAAAPKRRRVRRIREDDSDSENEDEGPVAHGQADGRAGKQHAMHESGNATPTCVFLLSLSSSCCSGSYAKADAIIEIDDDSPGKPRRRDGGKPKKKRRKGDIASAASSRCEAEEEDEDRERRDKAMEVIHRCEQMTSRLKAELNRWKGSGRGADYCVDLTSMASEEG